MEEKKSSGEKLEAFFAGKGFYVVLFLCVAVIGVSAWSMLSGSSGNVEDTNFTLEDNLLDEGTIMTGLTEYPVIAEDVVKTEPEPVVSPEAPEQNETIQDVTEQAEDAAVTEQSASSYFILPVAGSIENDYSMDTLVYNRTMADWRTHDGLDIAAEIGSVVMAAGEGTVEAVYSDDLFGTTVIITHAGEVRTIYSNLAAEPSVAVGDYVTVGQTIGSVGTTAICEANEVAHLHFAMSKSGKSVNPHDYLSQ